MAVARRGPLSSPRLPGFVPSRPASAFGTTPPLSRYPVKTIAACKRRLRTKSRGTPAPERGLLSQALVQRKTLTKRHGWTRNQTDSGKKAGPVSIPAFWTPWVRRAVCRSLVLISCADRNVCRGVVSRAKRRSCPGGFHHEEERGFACLRGPSLLHG